MSQTTELPKIIIDDTYFVGLHSPYRGKSARELEEKYNIRILRIIGKEIKNPKPDTVIEFMDTLVIEGDVDDIGHFLYEG